MQPYECIICGYLYDPGKGDFVRDVPPNTAFENLPEDWTCPVCGAGKDQFSPRVQKVAENA